LISLLQESNQEVPEWLQDMGYDKNKFGGNRSPYGGYGGNRRGGGGYGGNRRGGSFGGGHKSDDWNRNSNQSGGRGGGNGSSYHINRSNNYDQWQDD